MPKLCVKDYDEVARDALGLLNTEAAFLLVTSNQPQPIGVAAGNSRVTSNNTKGGWPAISWPVRVRQCAYQPPPVLELQ